MGSLFAGHFLQERTDRWQSGAPQPSRFDIQTTKNLGMNYFRLGSELNKFPRFENIRLDSFRQWVHYPIFANASGFVFDEFLATVSVLTVPRDDFDNEIRRTFKMRFVWLRNTV